MSVLTIARAIGAELDDRVSHGTVLRNVPWDSDRRRGADGANGTDGTDGTDGAHGADLTIGAAELETRPDAPLCPATIAKRAAIIAERDGCDCALAEARALAGQGFSSWQALADQHRENILKQLARLPTPINDQGRCLLRVTHAFLDTNHWQTAVELGWSLIDLFGINPHVPVARIECQGLVTGLALSKLNGGRLETIAEGHATIRDRSGSLLIWRRDAAGLDAAALWWECDALVGIDLESAEGAA
jgi:hypothetical protein